MFFGEYDGILIIFRNRLTSENNQNIIILA